MKKIIFGMAFLGLLNISYANPLDKLSKSDLEALTKMQTERDNKAKVSNQKLPENIQTISYEYFGKNYLQVTNPRAFYSEKTKLNGYITCFKNEKEEMEAIFTVDNIVMNGTLESPETKPFTQIFCSFLINYENKNDISFKPTIKEQDKKIIEVVKEIPRIKTKDIKAIYDFNNAIQIDRKLFANFMLNNKDKYISEINKIGQYDLDTIFKGNSKLDPILNKIEYDVDKNEANLRMAYFSPNITIIDDCKIKGSYVGSNAFGVKKRVTKKYCLNFSIGGDTIYTSYEDRNVLFKLQPNEYREIKDKELDIEIFFKIKGNEKKIISTYDKSFSEATIDSPIELETDSYSAYMDVLKINLKLPNQKIITIYNK